MNLLVVDDDHRLRKMLRAYFEYRGWQVSCAEDVEGARAFLEKGQFDTIITDIQMPGGSGMELLRDVKDAESLTQVILITGYRDLNYAIDAVNEGAFAFLEKPFQLDDLHERVLEALEVKYRAEEAEEERRNLAHLVGIREEEISFLKERSQAILSVFPSLLVLVNHESRIRDVNERFLKVFTGRKREKLGVLICDALQCPLYESGPCPEPCELWSALQSTIAKNRPSDRFTITPPFGGLPYPERPTFQVRILPLPALSPDGAKDREFLVIMEDISRERAMEMQILHSSRLASLGEMATGIAHELSQPLNVISTQTQLMRYKLERDGEISEDALCSAVDETMEQVFRMSDILQHLRVYGRRQAAAGYSEFTSQELLEGSLKLTQAQFKAWGIDLVVRFQDPQFKIGGKLHELQHALTNVLLNARDALREKRSALVDSNSPESRQLEINVDLRSFMRAGAPWVGIDISDNGTGIHPTAQERVFDPMFTTKADGEGSGLGLPIAAAILREHGGSVSIESEEDGGTRVFFEIPALNPEESND